MKAKTPQLFIGYGGDRMLSFPFDREQDAQAKKMVDDFRDCEIELTVKKYSEKRSLSANNFSWALTDQLAEVMLKGGVKLSKDEMHAEMIFRYGQLLKDADGNNVVLSTAQEVPVTDFYPYAKEFAESDMNGKVFKHYRIYRGSHTYTREEMSIFIDGIVAECEEQGIDTRTPEERARMLEAWDA